MTPIEELNAAATKIHRAGYATSHTGPWRFEDFQVVTESGFIADVYDAGDGHHIAMWSPAVAQLVGDLLAGHAALAEHGLGRISQQALDLARAINGTGPEASATQPLPDRAEGRA